MKKFNFEWENSVFDPIFLWIKLFLSHVIGKYGFIVDYDLKKKNRFFFATIACL